MIVKVLTNDEIRIIISYHEGQESPYRVLIQDKETSKYLPTVKQCDNYTMAMHYARNIQMGKKS